MARHRLVCGLRQWTHSRHWGENSVTTRSPGATLRDARRRPARPRPRPRARAPSARSPRGRRRRRVYRSVWQTPQASRRTSTSPARGSASSTSVTFSGAANSSSTAARIFTALLSTRLGAEQLDGAHSGAGCGSRARRSAARACAATASGSTRLARPRGGEQQPQVERRSRRAQPALGAGRRPAGAPRPRWRARWPATTSGWAADHRPSLAHEVVGGLALDHPVAAVRSARSSDRPRAVPASVAAAAICSRRRTTSAASSSCLEGNWR